MVGGSCCNMFVFIIGFLLASVQSLHALTSSTDLKQLHVSLQYFLLLCVSVLFVFPLVDPIFSLIPYHMWFMLKLCGAVLLAVPNKPYTGRIFDVVEQHYEDYGRSVLELVEVRALKPVREQVKEFVRKMKHTKATAGDEGDGGTTKQ
eukprot:GHVS01055347.1.p1 GENE.GHVS01055347.1~~GHVS01055347.1.p1  ORF type:complete len:148 (-),score=27.01 GHVS01055347.1:125-568(-)